MLCTWGCCENDNDDDDHHHHHNHHHNHGDHNNHNNHNNDDHSKQVVPTFGHACSPGHIRGIQNEEISEFFQTVVVASVTAEHINIRADHGRRMTTAGTGLVLVALAFWTTVKMLGKQQEEEEEEEEEEGVRIMSE